VGGQLWKGRREEEAAVTHPHFWRAGKDTSIWMVGFNVCKSDAMVMVILHFFCFYVTFRVWKRTPCPECLMKKWGRSKVKVR
jgi:hypothetical protein